MKSIVHELHNYSFEDITKTGVYTITSKFNNKIYVGSTSTNYGRRKSESGFINRWRSHVSELKGGTHCNKYLQNHVNKYGIEDLQFEILEICEPSLTVGLEQYWINQLNTMNDGFNLTAPKSILVGENRPNYIKLDEKEVVKLYLTTNLNIDKLSKQFNVSKNKIRRTLTLNNVIVSRTKLQINFNSIYLEYLNSKMTLPETSTKYGLSKHYMYGRLRREGLPDKIRIVNSNIDIIYKRYIGGTTIISLANEYGVNVQTIRNYFLNNNLKLLVRNKTKTIDDSIQVIYNEYFNSKLSVEKVAKKYNVGTTTLRRVFKNNNLKLKEHAIYYS